MAQIVNAIITGNLTVTGRLNSYTVGSAIGKNVDDSIIANSTNIPTSAAIADYVPNAIDAWVNSHVFTSVTTGTNANDPQVTDVIVPHGYSLGFRQALPKGWATASGSADVTASNLDISWQTNAFKISGTLTANGTATASITPGYILAGNKTDGSVSTAHQYWSENTVDTVGTDVDFEDKATILKPEIEDANIGITNKTRIPVTPQKSQSISTKYFVALSSQQNTTNLSATPKVSSEGYGDLTHYGTTSRSKTVGAASIDTTYLPISTLDATVALSTTATPNLSSFNLTSTPTYQNVPCKQVNTTTAGINQPSTSSTPSDWPLNSRHFYLAVNTKLNNGRISISTTINTPGYASQADEIPTSAYLSTNDRSFYIPLKTGILGTSSKAEAENNGGTYKNYPNYSSSELLYISNTPSIDPEGYLIINEGYYENSKISLGQLIGDIASVNGISYDATSDDMLKGMKAYNEIGQLMVGTIERKTLDTTYYTTNVSLGVENSIVYAKSYNNFDNNHYIKWGAISSNIETTASTDYNNLVAVSGWISSTNIKSITLTAGKKLEIIDGIASEAWVITKDSNGNVTIS